MTFFEDFSVPPMPLQPRTTRYVPPPWAAAPAYALPAVVHLGKFLHGSPTMVVAVKSADVHSTGCSFNLSWLFRRRDQSDEDWADVQHLLFQPGMGTRRSKDRQTGLMFGVQFPDGSKAGTGIVGPHGLLESGGQQPEPPTLVLNDGGGSGGGDEFSGSCLLWLWPLSPAGELRLVAQWLDFGLEETSIMLDGRQLREAAAGVQQYWPEE
ncbi:hypothetical protein [Pseudarthrobacter sp. NamB4]|uniref:hypothetical protein n=1 Tax=Pseudarthrobacter sp. NamB4 TaxID=2576837 RepID=UPI0014856AB2|nr:hypothetical protein [Pseudarthrobacter sp. NamB4]